MFNKNQNENVIKLGRMILRESDLEITVEYKGEVFTLKYPNPSISALIETEIARRLGGYNRSSFTSDHVAAIEACVTIDLTYVPEKCPKWFSGPWTCYDEELIAKLYEGYFHFRNKFRERMRTGGFEESGKGGGS